MQPEMRNSSHFPAFQPFKAALVSMLGSRFSRLILFGSYARGEEKQNSDIDVLLVVKGNSSNPDLNELLSPLVARFLLDYGLFFSILVKSEDELKTQKLGLMQNVEEEGVLL